MNAAFEGLSTVQQHRHPLQELVVNSFVANDTELGEIGLQIPPGDQASSSVAGERSSTDGQVSEAVATYTEDTRETNSSTASDRMFFDNRVMILTGANSSGKSIYLKQV